MNKKFVIITSINPPTVAVKAFASWNGWSTIVVGDRKSPKEWEIDGVIYLSLDDQFKFFPEYSKLLSENTYTRKILGYLYAFQHGAEAIFESDDDNIPYLHAKNVIESYLNDRRIIEPVLFSENGWLNIYKVFDSQNSWPRGFPIEKIHTSNALIDTKNKLPWGVLQFLADEDPDVDAIYRMTQGNPIYFSQNKKISLCKGTFSPFNSQATLWVPETFPLMFLPIGIKDRVTDILRGFISLACMWANGMTLGVSSPIVYQERNQHNLLNDFSQEIDLYLSSDIWCKMLQKVSGGGMDQSFRKSLQILVDNDILPSENLKVYSIFLNSLESL